MFVSSIPKLDGAYRFSIAPMLDCTDRHFRVLMRQISRRALLYSEMVVAKALHYSNKRSTLLDFDDIEHPISLQIGGDDPKLLADAARIAEEWGYDEINLNIGCPSNKVRSGNFGACLMASPYKVAHCVEAMSNASRLNVTVKHRIGIDNLDSEEFLIKFVDTLASAGAKRFAIHARKAWLNGLNPKENRSIPPLKYERVASLKEKRPELIIELNGGLETPNQCSKALKIFDGVMVGRAIYEDPLRWKTIDETFFNERQKEISASQVINALIPFAEKHLARGGKLWDISRHLLKLVKATPGARRWRQSLGISAQKNNADISILKKAVKELQAVGL